MPTPPREDGGALVEALLLGLLLLVPVVWMLSVFAELHAAALATTGAAREAGFEAARTDDAATAERAMTLLIEESMASHGLDPSLAAVRWSAPDGWRRGGVLRVAVTYDVPVFQAPFLGAITEASIPVRASHVTVLDRYRSRESDEIQG